MEARLNKLFIGMPVRNGSRFLNRALETLRAQSFKDWTLLISDNCSDDSTQEIAKSYAARDARIRYMRQSHNLGATGNFKYLLDQSKEEYFMWAAHDDEWERDYLSSCMAALDADPEMSLAFTNLINIDSFGRPIREYPNFTRFNSSDARAFDILSFLVEPEVLGKANLICGVHRRSACETAWEKSGLRVDGPNIWGADVIYVLAVLLCGRIHVDHRTLFRKRIPLATDCESSAPNTITIGDPNSHIFPLESTDEFVSETLRVLENERFYGLAKNLMSLRKALAEKNHALNLSAIDTEKMRDEISRLRSENEEIKKGAAFQILKLAKIFWSKSKILISHR